MTSRALKIIDHIHLQSADFEKASGFYLAIFSALGHQTGIHSGKDWLELDGFYIDQADLEAPVSRVHVAFEAHSRDQVKAFHEAGLRAGGTDNGQPGLRDYHPGYYAAYLLDPDGNNVEAKYDERTA